MSTAIAVPEVEAAAPVAAQALSAAQALAKQVLAIPITTSELAQWAITTAHQVRTQKRTLEEQRDVIAKPLRALASSHTRRWKPSIDLLEDVHKKLIGAAMAYQRQERARQAEALKTATTQVEVAQAVAVLAPKPAGLQERETWGWEVVDRAKVPAEYLLLDEKRLSREARERKAELAIPGIKPVRNVTGVLR